MTMSERTGASVSVASGWPWADPAPLPLPATLPDGSPWPRVTVVTPSFNQGRYIEQTILSVANQGYPNVEHIVIDGGSTDGTLEALERHRSKLAHVVSEKDRGQSDALNKGFRLATGEILTWINSDDMLAPGALGAAALALWESGADMVAGVCELYRDGTLVHRHLTSCANGPLPLGDLLDLKGCWLKGQFFYQPEVLFTRGLWERAGAQVREDAYYSMDYELWLRFARAGAKLHVIGRPIAHFRVHEEQKTAVASNYQAELPKVRDAFAQEHGIEVPAPAQGSKDRLRVVLFNDIGYAYGAGIAHRRIGAAFAAAGHEVRAVAGTSVVPFRDSSEIASEQAVRQIEAHQPDLVVVGNLHGCGLSPTVLGLIAAKFPTLFVLHDLWLVTGRCAYPGTCEAYLEACGPSCGCAPGYPDLAPDLVRPAWDAKRRILSSGSNLVCAGDSRYVAEVVRRAVELDPMCAVTGVRPPVDWVKYGFETDVLRPRDKGMCRELLGLPADRFIILSSASSLDDERKGLAHLARALEMLGLPDVLVVCAGRLPDGQKPPIPGMRAMGYMEDPLKLAMLYSAADIFVGPSLEEAFGQVFVEAAACGTPAVGYPVGGVPQAITHGVTGLVAERVDPEALAASILRLYQNAELRRSMGAWGAMHVQSEWSLVSAAHRLVEVMRATGLAERLKLGRKLTIASTNPAMPEPERVLTPRAGWRAVSGFDGWEGPYPEQGLPRCRWILGPVARFEIDAAQEGPHRVVIGYRNFEPGQRVRLIAGQSVVGEQDVPTTKPSEHRALGFQVHLRAGLNHLELHCWKWKPGARPMSLLVTSLRAVHSRGQGNGTPVRGGQAAAARV